MTPHKNTINIKLMTKIYKRSMAVTFSQHSIKKEITKQKTYETNFLKFEDFKENLKYMVLHNT